MHECDARVLDKLTMDSRCKLPGYCLHFETRAFAVAKERREWYIAHCGKLTAKVCFSSVLKGEIV